MKLVRHRFGIIILTSITLSSCSLFFGNIRPVEEHSTQYTILDLSQNSPSDWVRLITPLDKQSKKEPPAADQAYQSLKTSAIISLNSACKRYDITRAPSSSEQLTDELLLGISGIVKIKETEIIVSGKPALQTIATGTMNQEKIIVTTVVLATGACVFDLMYITKPVHYKKHLHTFDQFVSSFTVGS